MGEQNIISELEGEPLRSFERLLLRDLLKLEQMLESGEIESGVSRIGAEQELFLVGKDLQPAPVSMEVLKRISDQHFTTELSSFNIEANLDPIKFGDDCLQQMEHHLNNLLDMARRGAGEIGAEPVLIGILPTIRKSDLGVENLTPAPRYYALNNALCKKKGGTFEFYIRGLDELSVKHDSMMVESCNTSFQVHLQVDADQFAKFYNIAQALAGPILAAATNSPLLFGRRLWHETRIALFRQSVDTRRSSYYLRVRSPRVTFGTGWVKNSVLEIYREDLSRFRPLLGTELIEDSLSSSGPPQLKALRIQNGTIYRWNRPCYGITDGRPHLRIENRVLPSGPTIVDEVANSAFWLGLMHGMASEYGDISKRLEFEDAKMNFYSGARFGLYAQFNWFNREIVPAQTLICKQLLPLARQGLLSSGICVRDADYYLGVIERRVSQGRTGSEWLLQSFSRIKNHSTDGEVLNTLTSATIKNQKEGRPVAEWELAETGSADEWRNNYQKVEQYMTTDLFTVQEDEPIDLVVNLMDWNKIRHIPVEDNNNRLVGIISYRTLLRMVARGWRGESNRPIPVSEIMKKELVTVAPETLTLDAIEMMQRNKVSCLPVVRDGYLVGIVTERDFIKVTADLLKQKLQEENQKETKTQKYKEAKTL